MVLPMEMTLHTSSLFFRYIIIIIIIIITIIIIIISYSRVSSDP